MHESRRLYAAILADGQQVKKNEQRDGSNQGRCQNAASMGLFFRLFCVQSGDQKFGHVLHNKFSASFFFAAP